MHQEAAPRALNETAGGQPYQPAEAVAVNPAQLGGNTVVSGPLRIRFETFEDAQKTEKQLSPAFIDGCLTDSLYVGGEKVGIKGYLDKVQATEKDIAVIADPEQIAGIYLATTDMLARNLKVRVARNPDAVKDAARKIQIKDAKNAYLAKLAAESGQAADGIVNWCTGKSERFDFPVKELEYQGFEIDGKDPLDNGEVAAVDFRTNFRIQRQDNGTFIMGYSDARVEQKMRKQDEVLAKRIYLNPDALATPQMFEQVLLAANEAGMSIQLKMLQRAPELAMLHGRQRKGTAADSLRGDGIVIYAADKDANDVLKLVLTVAKDNPDVLIGRETSRIPQKIAEGIAVGDEPIQMPGTSLTSHRELIFGHVTSKIAASGLTGQAARDAFKRGFATISKLNGVNPHNTAFNL